MTDTKETAPPPDAAAPDFASLLNEASALEQVGVAQQADRQAEQQAAAIMSAAEELFGALQMVRMMAAPMMGWWPQFGEVWGDPTLRGIADGGAAVMERHGWTLGDAWGQFGPYIALIGAVLPPSLVTWQAVQQRRLEARRPPPRRMPPEDAEGVRP